MNIVRLSKEGEFQEKIEGFVKTGLLDYPVLGYQRWFWQYMENPHCLGQDPPVWLCDLDNKAVCHLGTIPVKLKMGPKIVKAAWAVDFMTLPDYRKKGIGRLLVEEANKNFDFLLAVGITASSFNLFVKMGWDFLGHVPYYVKIWDLKNLLKGKIKNKFIAACVFIPLGLFLSLFNLVKRPRKPAGIEVSRIDNFGEEAELFWKEVAEYYKIIVPRNKAFLNWKYDQQPGMRYVKFRAARRGRLCGYIIVRTIRNETGVNEGILTDIIVRPDDKDAINALLFEALQYLKGEGCAFMRSYATHPALKRILLSYGFMMRKCPMPFLMKKNIKVPEEAYSLHNWFITAGDCDIDRKISL